jgi:pyruvate ferredoxin oxidoreductase gamma subunit
VQDAPRYGAERRGAPIFAFVRASRTPINERGVIQQPDLVLVADDSLVAVPAAGVLAGITDQTVLLFYSNTDEHTWCERLNIQSPVLVVPLGHEIVDPMERRYSGTSCAAAAAQLTGVISRECLEAAIRQELSELGERVIQKNLDHAHEAYDLMLPHKGLVKEGEAISAQDYQNPEWTDLPFEAATISAPAIHASLTSEKSPTGLWRTMRPVIDYARCNRCWWVCSTFCPDGAIQVTKGQYPRIDYDHCKGCMVCVSQCPPHAIEAVPEAEAAQQPIEEAPE